MEDLKDRLVTAIEDYGNSERAQEFDAEDMAEYLMEVITELHKDQEEIIKEIDSIMNDESIRFVQQAVNRAKEFVMY